MRPRAVPRGVGLLFLRFCYLGGFRLGLGDQEVDREEVTFEAEASDYAFAGGRRDRLVAELFALVDIRDMHLDGLHAAAGDGVAEGDRDMGVASWIDH